MYLTFNIFIRRAGFYSMCKEWNNYYATFPSITLLTMSPQWKWEMQAWHFYSVANDMAENDSIVWHIYIDYRQNLKKSYTWYACSSKNREGMGGVLMVKKRCMFPTVVIMELTKIYMLMQERLKLYRCFHIYLSCMRSVVKWPRERVSFCLFSEHIPVTGVIVF